MQGLDALVEGLFDHAGLFPPASLGMDEMLRTAARFPETLHRPRMVGNELVWTPEQGATVDDERLRAAGFDDGRALGICLVGVPREDAAEVARQVKSHVVEGPRRVTSLEVQVEDMGPTTTRTAHELRFLLGEGMRVYLEPQWSAKEWTERRDEAETCLDTLNSDAEQPRVGLKVRCAGPTALGPEDLVPIVAASVAKDRPLKATQGLHHGVAGKDPVGFLGLTVALRLHGAGVLDGSDLAACIGEEDVAAFDVSDGIAWRGRKASIGALGEAMSKVPFAIGSCSIHEPDAELKAAFG